MHAGQTGFLGYNKKLLRTKSSVYNLRVKCLVVNLFTFHWETSFSWKTLLWQVYWIVKGTSLLKKSFFLLVSPLNAHNPILSSAYLNLCFILEPLGGNPVSVWFIAYLKRWWSSMRQRIIGSLKRSCTQLDVLNFQCGPGLTVQLQDKDCSGEQELNTFCACLPVSWHLSVGSEHLSLQEGVDGSRCCLAQILNHLWQLIWTLCQLNGIGNLSKYPVVGFTVTKNVWTVSEALMKDENKDVSLEMLINLWQYK